MNTRDEGEWTVWPCNAERRFGDGKSTAIVESTVDGTDEAVVEGDRG